MSGQAGLAYAFELTHHSEVSTRATLLRLAERHHEDHEVHHVASDLALWSADNIYRLSQVAAAHDLDLEAHPGDPGGRSAVREAASALVRHRPETGIVLLEGLRDAYLAASKTSLAWEMLAQHAQAAREEDVLDLTTACHPQTLRQVRWCNTMLKTLSPQVLASL